MVRIPTFIKLSQMSRSDSHGEVCPANWKPGSATINPDPEKKLEYFKKAAMGTQ